MYRYRFVDIARGIGMLSVVIGHHIILSNSGTPFEKSFCDFFWSFHMPLFFILSGYFFNIQKYSIKQQVIKDAKHILLPCVVTIFASYFYDIIIGNVPAAKLITRSVAAIFLLVQPIGVWFLLSLFWGRLFCKVALKYNKYQMGIITLLLFNALVLIIPFDMVKFTPFMINRALTCPVFILIGILCRRDFPFERLQANLLYTVIAILIMASAPLLYFDMSMCAYPLFTMNIVTATALTAGFLYLCYILEKVTYPTSENATEVATEKVRIGGGNIIYLLKKGINIILRLPVDYIRYIGRHSLAVLCYHAFLISAVRLQDYIPIESTFTVGLIVSIIISIIVYLQTSIRKIILDENERKRANRS